MTDDITQRLRVTMPDFKGIEISCPCRIRSLLMREAADEIEKLTRERDEARAEVERLREALVLGSEVLVSHQGSLEREWHSGGAWLYAGDTINVVRAPLPEIEVVS
jgi:hypothetical protein